jgi:Ca-activated chloride channel family protein
MNFAQPLWLIVGVLVCAALVWRYRRFDRQQTALLDSFVSPRLKEKLTHSFSPQRRRIKRALFVVATACLFVALARPQAGFRWEETHRKGLEILFAVDTSKSMLAQDVKPNRLTRAKLAVEDLLGKLNGDGVGLIAFAGNAFLQCPITLDYDAFRESLGALDTRTIPRGGTEIAAAIREAETTFKTRTASERILILITDGEDLGGEGIAAAESAAKEGVKIFTVGVGSTSGELVPVPTEVGGIEFAKDASGQFVKSRLDEGTLRQIAGATGGMYQPLGRQGQGLITIYEEGLKPFTRHNLASRQHKVFLEQFQWPLLAAFVLFVIESLFGTRRRTARSEPATAKSPRNVRPSFATIALALVFSALPGISHASPISAEKAYQKGNFSQAVKDYAASAQKQPAKAELQFNLGAATYKAGEFGPAAAEFQKALKTEQLPVQQSAFYNLGNAQYRIGQKTELANPQETIKTWQSAVQSYEAALQIKPDDADAKYNRDLVKRKLEQLQRRQQQQQQQKDQQNNQQNSQRSQSDQNKSDQNQSKDSQKNRQQNNGGPGQGQKPHQQNASVGGNKKSNDKPQQQANTNAQPEPKKPSKDTPETNAQPDSRPGDAQSQAEARREPGQMTKEEAKSLLDSLKGEERRVAAAPLSRGSNPDNDNQPLKDW